MGMWTVNTILPSYKSKYKTKKRPKNNNKLKKKMKKEKFRMRGKHTLSEWEEFKEKKIKANGKSIKKTNEWHTSFRF